MFRDHFRRARDLKMKENKRFYGFTDFRGKPERRGKGSHRPANQVTAGQVTLTAAPGAVSATADGTRVALAWCSAAERSARFVFRVSQITVHRGRSDVPFPAGAAWRR